MAFESATIRRMHEGLRRALHPLRSRQDAQGLTPHETLVNKVVVEEAIEKYEAVAAEYFSWEGAALGFDVWTHEGGPWRFVESLAFLDGCAGKP